MGRNLAATDEMRTLDTILAAQKLLQKILIWRDLKP